MTQEKSYSELVKFRDFRDRYYYLRIKGYVGAATFGFDRYLNQQFYTSNRWKNVRNKVILRDKACDLSHEDYEIRAGKLMIHHMNPLTIEMVEGDRPEIYEPEFLICVSFYTHNAIHFGDEHQLPQLPIERKPFDTSPWRQNQNGRGT